MAGSGRNRDGSNSPCLLRRVPLFLLAQTTCLFERAGACGSILILGLEDASAGLTKLKNDLDNGDWNERYGAYLERDIPNILPQRSKKAIAPNYHQGEC